MKMKSIWNTTLRGKPEQLLNLDTIIHSVTSGMCVDLELKPWASRPNDVGVNKETL